MNLNEIKNSSELVFDGEVLHVYKDEASLPDGTKGIREVIRHVGAVGIVGLIGDDEIIMEHQFRYPLNKVITEIPAGKLNNKNENRLLAAKREFKEETGYSANEWIYLGDYAPTAAYTDEIISLYLARGLNKGEQNLDADEFLDVFSMKLDDAVEKCLDGSITDGKTITAILRAKNLLTKRRI